MGLFQDFRNGNIEKGQALQLSKSNRIPIQDKFRLAKIDAEINSYKNQITTPVKEQVLNKPVLSTPSKSANPYIRSGQDTEEERLKRLEEYNKNPIYKGIRKTLIDNPISQNVVKPLVSGFNSGQANLIAKPISAITGDKEALNNIKYYKKNSTENLNTTGKIANTIGDMAANVMYAPVLNKIPGVGKGLDKLGSVTKSKYLNTALREGTENALFSGLTNASDVVTSDMTVKDYAKNVALEGVGGAVFGTTLKGISNLGKGINNKVTSGVNKLFDDVGNPIKTTETPQLTSNPFKNPVTDGLTLPKKTIEVPKIETPIEKPGLNIKNPKGMNFYQTKTPKTETIIHQQPKVTIRKEKVNVDGGIGSIKIEERGNMVKKVDKNGKVKEENNLSDKKVNALQYDFPELRPQIKDIANTTLGDLDVAIPGKKYHSEDSYTGEKANLGQTKFVEPIIQEIQDYLTGSNGKTKRGKDRPGKVKSYAEIRQALSDIVEDNGKENYATAKKVEHILVKNLEYGQVRNDGVEIPPSLDFIDNKNMLMEMDKGTKVNVNNTVFKGNIETPITKTIPGERIPVKQPLNIEPLPKVEKPRSVAAFKDTPTYAKMDIGEEELKGILGQGVDTQKPIRKANNPSKINSNGDLEGESRFKTITSMESELVDTETKKLLAKKDLNYDVKTDKDMVSYADRIVKTDSNKAYEMVMDSDKPSAEITSIGVRLIPELQKQGKFRETMDLINKMSLEATQSGQSIQKLSLIKKLTPEGMLYHLNKEVENAKKLIEQNNPRKITKADEVFEKLKQSMDTIDNEALDGLLSDFDNKIDDIINGVKSIDNEPITPIKQGENVDSGTTTKKKNKPGEKEVILPEQKLANRVDNTLKEPKPKSQDIEKNMIDTLFNISKKTLPEKTKNAPTDPFTFVKFALERKNEYQQVFQEAKKILVEKYGKDSQEVVTLQDWIDQKARPIFFDNNMNTSIKNTLKDKGIKISELVKKHYSNNTEVRTTLKDTLIAKGGLNEQDANTVSNYIERYMKDATKEAKEKQLKTIFKEKDIKKLTVEEKVDKKIKNIEELSNLGAFKNGNYTDLLQGKLNPNIDRLVKSQIDIGKLVKQFTNENQELRKNGLSKYLLERANLDVRDTETLTNAIEKRFNELILDKKNTEIMRLFTVNDLKEVTPQEKTQMLFSKINEMNNLGIFDNDVYKSLFEGKINKNIENIVKDKLNIGDFVKNTIKSKQEITKENISKYINDNVKLDSRNVDFISKRVMERIDEIVIIQKNKELEKIFSVKELKKLTPLQKRDIYYKNINTLSNLGAFDNSKYVDLLPGKINNNVDKIINYEIDLGKMVKEMTKNNQAITVKSLSNKISNTTTLTGSEIQKLSEKTIKRFEELISSKKDSILNQKFKEKVSKPKKTMVENISELNNLSAFDNAKYKDLIYDKYGIPRLNENDINAITDGMEKYQGMPDGREKDVQLAQVMKIVKDKIPSTMMEKIDSVRYINMLLNPRTLIKNVVGNMVNTGVSVPRDIIATGIDKMVSKKTGTRTKGIPNVKDFYKDGKQGVKYAREDSKLGIDTTLGGMKEGSKSKALRNVPVLGKLEKALSFGLSVGDRPFYEMAYQNSLKNAMKLNKVETPTPQMLENAIQDGLEATYQQKTGLGDFVNSAKNSNWKPLSLTTKAILPFSQTPSAILDTALNYSPVGLVKGGLNLTKNGLEKGGQRKGVNQLASGILGTVAIIGGYAGAKNGILQGGENQNYETAAIERQAGKQPYSLKVGDKYFNLDWAQPGASPLMTGADMQKIGAKKSGPTEMLKSGINSVMNNSFLSGANQMLDSVSQDGFGSIPQQLLKNYSSQLLPMSSMANAINKTVDSKTRDTYDPNKTIQEVKKAMAKYPGLAQLLPQGVDSVGQLKLNNDGKGVGGRALNNMVTPWNSTEFNPSKAEKKALETYNKTGETTQMPRLAPKYIEYKGTSGNKEKIDLTQKERIELQTYIGQQTEKRLSSLNDPSKMQTLLTQISKEGQNKILAKRKLPQKK